MLKGALGLTLSKADYWAVYLTFSPEFFSQLFSLFILESGISVRVNSQFYLWFFTWKDLHFTVLLQVFCHLNASETHLAKSSGSKESKLSQALREIF